jgi:hypothetical protein
VPWITKTGAPAGSPTSSKANIRPSPTSTVLALIGPHSARFSLDQPTPANRTAAIEAERNLESAAISALAPVTVTEHPVARGPLCQGLAYRESHDQSLDRPAP